MVDVLTSGTRALELAELWDQEAEVVERWAPESDTARVLRQCAARLRQVTDETAPDEVTLSVVRDRTGWSLGWLQERAQDLAEKGQARKGSDGAWRVDRDAALRIPVKRGHRPALEGVESLPELADRILDMQTT